MKADPDTRRLTSLEFAEGLEVGERRAETAFVRLHKLVGKGYRPLLGPKEIDDFSAIWLRHPGGPPHKDLILYPTGLLVELIGSEKDELRIEDDEEERFRGFLSSVRPPSLWERVSYIGARGALYAVALMVLYGLPMLLLALLVVMLF